MMIFFPNLPLFKLSLLNTSICCLLTNWHVILPQNHTLVQQKTICLLQLRYVSGSVFFVTVTGISARALHVFY